MLLPGVPIRFAAATAGDGDIPVLNEFALFGERVGHDAGLHRGVRVAANALAEP